MNVVFQMVQFLDMTVQKIHRGSAHSASSGKMCWNVSQNTNESLLWKKNKLHFSWQTGI